MTGQFGPSPDLDSRSEAVAEAVDSGLPTVAAPEQATASDHTGWAHSVVLGFRFIIAGGSNTLLSYAVYLLLLPVLPYWASYSLGYVAGIFLSYLLSRFFVFRANASLIGSLVFPFVYVGQWLCGLAITWAWVGVFGYSKFLAPLVASALTLPLTFLLSRKIFRHSRGSRDVVDIDESASIGAEDDSVGVAAEPVSAGIEDGPTGVGVEGGSSSGRRGRGIWRVLSLAISGAVIAGFEYIVYGYVFADGLCCADDSSIAVAAKNLAFGYGYATSVPYQGAGGMRAFDPLLSTGPTMVLPAAALIRVFGNTPWAPGLATALVTTIVLAILTVVASRRVGAVRAVAFVALMLALQYTLTAGDRFVQWYSLVGEVPAAMLTVLAVAVLAWGRSGRRAVVWVFLALGLAFMSKTLALLGAIPVGIWFVLLLVRSGGRRRREWIDIAVGAVTFAAPFLAFEAWKVVALGREKYLVNLRDFGNFFSSTGGGGGANDLASVRGRIASNSAAFHTAFGFGPLKLLLAVGALCLVVHLAADRRAKIFCWLTMACGMTHILWFVASSNGNPRYSLIGMLVLAAGAAAVVLVSLPGRAAVATAAIVALSCFPAVARLPGPVIFVADGGFRPVLRLHQLQVTADYLAGVHHDEPLVGSWWATVVDLEYMLPTVMNFEKVEDVDPGEMHKGRLIAQNGVWVAFAPDRLFEQWEQTCDKVMFSAPSFLVTACPSDGLP